MFQLKKTASEAEGTSDNIWARLVPTNAGGPSSTAPKGDGNKSEAA